ncbi:hypothetical protein ABT168_29510 [Streptomyces sp. NPDC001793]|uniref:hypothetical protein n=1 Tax=Streptomyces sp. NPDC001793 TaxID=3154657 RepID=UPI003323A7FB
MPHPAVRGVRRPVALLAFLWLIISVVGHHSLPGDAVPMSMASMPRTSIVQEAADQSDSHHTRRTHLAQHTGHAPPGLAHTGHTESGPVQSGQARSGHGHDGGAHCCSSYDVRSEQLVPPPALLGHARAPHHTAPSVPGPVPAPGPSPPDPASLSVLRI